MPHQTDHHAQGAGGEQSVQPLEERTRSSDPPAGQIPEHRGGDRGNRGEDSFRIPGDAGHPRVIAEAKPAPVEKHAIPPGGHCSWRFVEHQLTHAAAIGDWQDGHDKPVAVQERDNGENLLLHRGALRQQPGDEIGEPNALQHAHDAPVIQAIDDALEEGWIRHAGDIGPGEERKSVHQESEEEDQRAAAQDLTPDGGLVVAARAPRIQRQVGCNADDEQEEREDEVRWRPPVPRGMLEGRIDRAPAARVVHEQHSGDRETAEHVQ